MKWREAFFKQAWDDYSMFAQLSNGLYADCQKLHYLQMSTEKLAKAFLCGMDNTPPETSHIALTKFLRHSKGNPIIRRQLGFGKNYKDYVAYINGLLPFADMIENLAPEGVNLNKPNSEYPWLIGPGDVIAPVDYKFHDIFGKPREMYKLKFLISNLFRIGIT